MIRTYHNVHFNLTSLRHSNISESLKHYSTYISHLSQVIVSGCTEGHTSF
jgi:hypothetical protein